MFTHIKLKNFKAIKNLDLPLSPITAFIGPNDSGKSSILQAIHIAMQLAWGKDCKDIFIDDWQLKQLQTKNISIPIYLEFDGKSSSVASFKWHFTLEDDILSDEYYDIKGQKNFSIKHSKSILLDTFQSSLIIHGFAYLHFNSNKLKQPSYSEEEQPELQTDGSNLPSVLSAMQGLYRDRFEELEKRFIEIVPTIKRILIGPAMVFKDEFETIRINNDIVTRKISRRYTGHCLYVDTISGDRIPAAHISDGSILILGYLAALFAQSPTNLLGKKQPTLLLIEEPETGIHPKSLKIVMETFRNCPDRDDVQILMTSHSPYLIDFLEPEEIVLTRRENGYTETARLDELPDIRKWLENLSPGELWTMGGEDELMEKIRQKRGGNG